MVTTQKLDIERDGVALSNISLRYQYCTGKGCGGLYTLKRWRSEHNCTNVSVRGSPCLIIEPDSGWVDPGEAPLELLEAGNLVVLWVFQFPEKNVRNPLSDIKYFELGFFRHATLR